MIDIELYNKLLHAGHFTILDSYIKANKVLNGSEKALCSVSGGSDSDIMLDMIHTLDESGKVTYYWINTGLEYQATKDHLDELEQKYGIEIVRLKPDKSIPLCVKEYGVPFLSKYVSEQMMRLQNY